MTDIERRLRELGERVRQEETRSVLRPETLRAAGRRRVGTLGMAVGVLAVLVFGGTYAAGGLLDAGPDIGPSGRSQASFARLFSDFGDDERAIVEINADEGTVCVDLTSLTGYESFTRVEIVTDPTDPQTFVPVLPSDNALMSEAGIECVGDVDDGMASAIIEDPLSFFLLVESSGGDVRVSALTRGSGDRNYAIGREYTIAEGIFRGLEWRYYGFDSDDGLCLHLAIGSAGGGGCGETKALRGELEVTGLQSMQEPDGTNASALEGRVSDEVASLEIEIGDAPPEVIEIHDPPDELGLTDRVFVYVTETERFVGDPEVHLVAYSGSGRLLAKLAVEGFEDAANERQAALRQEGFAIWPEDTAREAEEACSDAMSPTRTFRYDPMSAALEFADAVLGWEQAIGIVQDSDHEAQSIELRRSSDDYGKEAQGAAALVTLTEVSTDCWSVWSVSPLPDERPTDLSVTIRGRDVEIGFDDLGAESIDFEMGHGSYTIGSNPEPPDGRITALLRYPLDQTGYLLLLFKEESGEVFRASGLPLPAGDFFL